MVMPLAYVVTCNHIQDPATRHNVLMIGTQGPGHQRPQLHYFQCARTPVSWTMLAITQQLMIWYRLRISVAR